MHGGDPTRDLNLERPTLYPLHHILSQNWKNVFFTGLDGGEDLRAQAASLSSRFPPVGEFQEEEEQGCRRLLTARPQKPHQRWLFPPLAAGPRSLLEPRAPVGRPARWGWAGHLLPLPAFLSVSLEPTSFSLAGPGVSARAPPLPEGERQRRTERGRRDSPEALLHVLPWGGQGSSLGPGVYRQHLRLRAA